MGRGSGDSEVDVGGVAVGGEGPSYGEAEPDEGLRHELGEYFCCVKHVVALVGGDSAIGSSITVVALLNARILATAPARNWSAVVTGTLSSENTIVKAILTICGLG